MDIYIPTFLYIKKHSITGKLYFGKTIKNPETYKGSGKRWKSHIKKHGEEFVTTLWYCLFLDKETLTSFALMISKQENIVDSENWLNLCEENGLDGGPRKIKPHKKAKYKLGKRHSELHKQKISNNNGSKIKCSCIKCKKIVSSSHLEFHLQTCQKEKLICSCIFCKNIISPKYISFHYNKKH